MELILESGQVRSLIVLGQAGSSAFWPTGEDTVVRWDEVRRFGGGHHLVEGHRPCGGPPTRRASGGDCYFEPKGEKTFAPAHPEGKRKKLFFKQKRLQIETRCDRVSKDYAHKGDFAPCDGAHLTRRIGAKR